VSLADLHVGDTFGTLKVSPASVAAWFRIVGHAQPRQMQAPTHRSGMRMQVRVTAALTDADAHVSHRWRGRHSEMSAHRQGNKCKNEALGGQAASAAHAGGALSGEAMQRGVGDTG
jgi:hypothetical protein